MFEILKQRYLWRIYDGDNLIGSYSNFTVLEMKEVLKNEEVRLNKKLHLFMYADI